MRADRTTIETLLTSALPGHSRWMLDGTPLDFKFAVVNHGLQPLPADVLKFDDNGTWSDLLMFGEFDYAEGGGAQPFLCVRADDGSVCGLDLEREGGPIFPLNSSADKFVTTFRLFDSYLAHDKPLPPDCIDRIRAINPEVASSSLWLSLAEEFFSSHP